MKSILELIRQNRFYATMLVINSTITITYVVIVLMMTMLVSGNCGSEPNRSRQEIYFNMTKKMGDKSVVIRGFNRRFAQEILSGIEELDFYSIKLVPNYGKGFVAEGRGIKLFKTHISDENIFRVFKYDFIEGAPYTKDDIESGNRVAVISKSTAYKLLGRNSDVVGSYIQPYDEKNSYKVVGLIDDPSAIFNDSYCDVILPLLYNYGVKDNPYDGQCNFTILLKDGYTFEQADRSINLAIEKYVNKHSAGQDLSYETFLYRGDVLPIAIPILSIFIFLLIPAINSLGISSSYISSRLSEIAIRKVYGAKNRDIIGLILGENLAISLIGAMCGLLISYPAVLIAFKLLNYRQTVYIPSDVILDYKLYLLIIFALITFNLFSIYFPLRRVSKQQISDIIK